MGVDVELDEATGLPVLPEGYFWRVREENSNRVYKTIYVELCRMEMVTTPAKTQRHVRKKFWTGKMSYTTEVVAEAFTQEELVVLRSRDLSENKMLADAEVSVGEGWTRIDFQAGTPVGHSRYTRYLETTPENVLKVAKEIWGSELEIKAEAARVKAVVGIYPPKKLELELGL